jgi:hypothetical protein
MRARARSTFAVPWIGHLGYTFGLPLLQQLILEKVCVYVVKGMRMRACAFSSGTRNAGTGRQSRLYMCVCVLDSTLRVSSS